MQLLDITTINWKIISVPNGNSYPITKIGNCFTRPTARENIGPIGPNCEGGKTATKKNANIGKACTFINK